MIKEIGEFFRHYDDWFAHTEAGNDVAAMLSFAKMVEVRDTIGAISYETLKPLFTPK